jgi:hypothetical protein
MSAVSRTYSVQDSPNSREGRLVSDEKEIHQPPHRSAPEGKPSEWCVTRHGIAEDERSETSTTLGASILKPGVVRDGQVVPRPTKPLAMSKC